MAYRFLVGDRTGKIINELGVDLQSVGWRRNRTGQATFRISTKNPKSTVDNLRFGNRVVIQFDNGLPAWGGVIDPPRDWKDGFIDCKAYSAGHVLSQRVTDKGRHFSNATVGYIFQSLIEEANAVEATGITVDSVWTSGSVHSPAYHFKEILKIIQDSLCTQLSTADYEIVPVISGGKIGFKASLYERLGSSKAGTALIEGKNAGNIRYLEQGPIVNRWRMAGTGSGWGDDRITSTEEDEVSRSVYGLREGSGVFGSVSDQTTLDAHATNLLEESKDPHDMLSISALNQDVGFADYSVGDSVMAYLPSYGFGGFSGLVKVEGRTYQPSDGVCDLVLRVEE